MCIPLAFARGSKRVLRFLANVGSDPDTDHIIPLVKRLTGQVQLSMFGKLDPELVTLVGEFTRKPISTVTQLMYLIPQFTSMDDARVATLKAIIHACGHDIKTSTQSIDTRRTAKNHKLFDFVVGIGHSIFSGFRGCPHRISHSGLSADIQQWIFNFLTATNIPIDKLTLKLLCPTSVVGETQWCVPLMSHSCVRCSGERKAQHEQLFVTSARLSRRQFAQVLFDAGDGGEWTPIPLSVDDVDCRCLFEPLKDSAPGAWGYDYMTDDDDEYSDEEM